MNKRILSVLLIVALLVAGSIFAVQANEIPEAPAAVTASDFVADNAKNNVYAAAKEMDFSDPNNLPTNCPYCGKDSGITWKALPGAGATRVLSAGHYYAADNINMEGKYYVLTGGTKVCINLNGKTIEANGHVFDARIAYTKDSTVSPAVYNFVGASKSTLNIMGEGTVIGGGTTTGTGGCDSSTALSSTYGGSVIYATGDVNLCGGTYKHRSTTKLATVSVNQQATLTIYEGTKFTADEGVKGRNIVVESGKLYMYGGIVEKGDVTGETGVNRFGGNILIKGSGTYSASYTQQSWLAGGIIRDGKAHNGGNIAIFGLFGTNGLNVRFVNCWIDNGQAVKTAAGVDGDGGNIFIQYGENPTSVVRFNNATKLTISDGQADGRGGNLYFYQNLASTKVATCHMIVQGGAFLDGEANEGGNFYVTGGKGNFYIGGEAYVSGGRALHEVDAGTGKVTKEGNGGNVYIAGGKLDIASVVFNESKPDEKYYKVPTIIDGWADSRGGNIYVAAGTVSFEAGNVVGGDTMGSHVKGIPGETRFTPTASNVYIVGGTFKMVDTKAKCGFDTLLTGGTGENGGNIYLDGETAVLDIQGGIIEKGHATSRGNNVYLRQGEVKFTGGEIRNNTTEAETQDFDGNSIYAGSIASTKISKITIGGNVVLNTPDATSNIYMNNQTTGFVVEEDFTGDVRVSFAGTNDPATAPVIRPGSNFYGYAIGSEYVKENATSIAWGAEGAYTGKLTMVLGDTTMAIFPQANGAASGLTHNLVTASVRGTSFVTEGEETVKVQTWYASAEEAIAGGDDYFALFAANDFEVAAGQTAVVNLNGKNITVSGEGKLTFFDANTNKGTVTLEGNVQLENNHDALVKAPEGATYLTIKNQDNTYSSYKLANKLKGVSLRPSTAGIYFRGEWSTELAEVAPEAIKSYGIVISRTAQPGADFKSQDGMFYTEYGIADFDGEQKTGVEITGIFKAGEDNATRGTSPIYAASYAVVNNGVEDVVVLTTVEDQYSMYSVLNMMEDSETVWGAYADALNAFYGKWAADLTGWSFDRLGK